MSKFCAYCGTALEDEARFCPSCGGEQPDEFAPAQPVQQSAQQPAKPKKRKQRFVVLGSIVSAVVVISLIFVLLILPLINGGGSSGGAENSVTVFSEGGNDYYVAYHVFKLSETGVPSLVKMAYDDGTVRNPGSFNYGAAARDGSTIYSRIGVDAKLDKITITGENAMRAEEWMTAEDLAKSPFVIQSEGMAPERWVYSMRNFSLDDEYLYFNLIPPADYAAIAAPIGFKVGRISLSTKEITEIKDVIAYDFVLYDGWIYYIDPGYYYDETTAKYGKADLSRVGIYKVRPDGSDKSLIRSLSWGETDGYHYAIADELSAVDGKLYYTDYSAAGKGRVCRMNTDGGELAYVSGEAAHFYAVDTDHNKVYYTHGSYDEGRGASVNIDGGFYCYDCASGRDSGIPYLMRTYTSLTYYNGYVYFSNASDFRYSNYGQGAQPDSVCGGRLNVSTGKVQNLIGYNDGETVKVTDPKTGRTKGVERVEGKDFLYWEDAEPNR